MLSCKEIAEKASDYLDKDLPLSTRIGFKLHLLMCGNCSRYVQQLKLTIQSLTELVSERDSQTSPQAMDELVKAFKESK